MFTCTSTSRSTYITVSNDSWRIMTKSVWQLTLLTRVSSNQQTWLWTLRTCIVDSVSCSEYRWPCRLTLLNRCYNSSALYWILKIIYVFLVLFCRTNGFFWNWIPKILEICPSELKNNLASKFCPTRFQNRFWLLFFLSDAKMSVYKAMSAWISVNGIKICNFC